MKKAQGSWIVAASLFFLVVFIFLIMVIFRMGASGRVVSEIDSDETTTLQNNYLTGVLELRAAVANEKGVKLDVKNGGSEAYIVRMLEVSGCGSANQEVLISPGASKILSISCSLEKGTSFEGDISLSYSKTGSSELLVSKGKVKDNV